VRAPHDRVGRPGDSGGDRHRGDVQEIAGGASQAAVGSKRDHRCGEVRDGLNGKTDGQRRDDSATAVDGDENRGCEEPGEPQERFAARVGERTKAAPARAELIGALPSGGTADQ